MELPNDAVATFPAREHQRSAGLAASRHDQGGNSRGHGLQVPPGGRVAAALTFVAVRGRILAEEHRPDPPLAAPSASFPPRANRADATPARPGGRVAFASSTVAATCLAAHDGAVLEEAEARRAVVAAITTASALGLEADDAVVLSDSNRLVVRLTPCDIVARVTPMTHFASAEREVAVVDRLSETDSPVATLEAGVEPRVFVRDGFKIAMWTYFERVQSRMPPPAEYAQALQRLHAGLRQIDVAAPHFMDRVAAAERDVVSRGVTPDLADADRALLAKVLRDLRRSIVERRAPEQLLHGEPHPGNVLSTKHGLLFTDFENTVHGPVEFDLGWVPKEVSERHLHADQDLVGECRGVVLAIIAMHRWSRDDQHPSGRRSGVAFLNALRGGPPWPALDDVAW